MDPLILHKIIVIAFLVEIITNFIKNIVPDLNKTFIMISAGVIGILISMLTGIGILDTLEIPTRYPMADSIITGIIVSRGANLVHDLSKKLNL